MNQVWLTTLAEITANALGPIWIRPADYRLVTKATAFDTDRPPVWPYRRRPEREDLVEKTIAKLGLLAS